MRLFSKKSAALFGLALAGTALLSTPALANAQFVYTFQQSSGPDAVTGTLTLVMNFPTTTTPANGVNVPLSDIVSFDFKFNGVDFTQASTGKSITALQFGSTSGAYRDVTFSGTILSGFAGAGDIFQESSPGVLTLVGSRGQDIGTFALTGSSIVPVPEPGSLPLMLAGLGTLAAGFFVRGRKRLGNLFAR